MKRSFLLFGAGCLLSASALASPAAGQRPDARAVRVDSNVAIAMRDGVVLRADIWRPRSEGRYPVLVYRTPYDKREADAALSTARKAVARGYAVVLQDVRGRHASDGNYVAYQQEGRDGYDTIEWAAAQSWSDGFVGTFGLSYPGAVQWLAALESPPHLKAMVPAMTFASPVPFWYAGGVWDLSWISWIYNNIAPDRRRRLGLPRSAPWDSVKDRMRGTLPLSQLKDLAAVAPWYYEWLKHPPYDPWWSWAELQGKYDKTAAAVLNFSAWYDESYGPHGAINNFLGLVAARRGIQRTALVMGPWSHGVPDPADTVVGERPLGLAASFDYDEMVLSWMDQHVKGADVAPAPRRPVSVFVLGSNRWVSADSWPIPQTRLDTIVFKHFSDQSLVVSDPANPVVNQFADRYGAHDYRALAARRDVAVLETPPLRDDLTVIGAMKAELTISLDVPDADIWVKVFDVAPDGTAYNLMSSGLDVVRASYRNARATRELLQPGRLYRIRLGNLFTANTFKKGHKLRVVVLPSFFPDFSRNLHTGMLESASAESRVANITVFHDDLHPFRLILPVVPASAILDPVK